VLKSGPLIEAVKPILKRVTLNNIYRMRILWLSHIVPYPPKGGVLQRSYHLLRETASRHQVTLFAFVQQRPLEQCFGDLETGLAESEKALSHFCSEVRFLPIPMESKWQGMARLAARSLFSRNSYTMNWLRSKQFAHAMRELSADSFDLVHADTISLAPYVSYFPGIPRALDHHNVESQMMLRRADNDSNPLKRIYFRQEARKILREERRYCPEFNTNIMCSKLDAERLIELVPSARMDVIPNGVDVDYFRPQPEQEVPGRLVFAGRMAAYTNRQAALFIVRELWPVLAQAFPEITFDLVGGGPPAEATALALRESRFRAPGFVDDIRISIAEASIYVCPITDGGGTKLKVLDALAMGKALVADPIACEGIDVVEGESVRFASTPQEYVRVIGELLNDPMQRSRLAGAGRLLVEDYYGYAGIGKKLSETYFQLANK